MKTLLASLALIVTLVVPPAYGQTFSSGSTGANGVLNLGTACPGKNYGNICVVQLPPSGVFNFTTVDIPAGKSLRFRRNVQNTPVVFLAQGDVTIAGDIELSAGTAEAAAGAGDRNGSPGPGGFYGGLPGKSGFGPGGGIASAGTSDPNWHGRWVGPISLVPIIGGSGGAGAGSYFGGGGGGAIVIASSTRITVSGTIYADGGASVASTDGTFYSGNGSGGSVRLVSNAILVSGKVLANGGRGGVNGGSIRFEAPAGALTFDGTASPAAVLSPVNPVILPVTPTSLSIVSVGGFQVPSYSGQRFDSVDLVLPMQLPDPINIVVAASNIPVGTQVGLGFGTSNSGTVTPGVLTGSLASSTATIQVADLNRTALAYLFVSATFGVSSGAAQMNPPGADQVAQVRVTAAPGAAPQFTFQRADGSTIDAQRLPADLLKHFRP